MKTYKIKMTSGGGTEYTYLDGLTYKEALQICEDNHWTVDNGIFWDLCIEEGEEKKSKMRIAYKVKGLEGHRQSASFGRSSFWDFSQDGDVRKISVLREDILQTNDHVIVIIERNTAEECEAELNGQLSDGIFENCRVGGVEVLYGEEVELDDR